MDQRRIASSLHSLGSTSSCSFTRKFLACFLPRRYYVGLTLGAGRKGTVCIDCRAAEQRGPKATRPASTYGGKVLWAWVVGRCRNKAPSHFTVVRPHCFKLGSRRH